MKFKPTHIHIETGLLCQLLFTTTHSDLSSLAIYIDKDGNALSELFDQFMEQFQLIKKEKQS